MSQKRELTVNLVEKFVDGYYECHFTVPPSQINHLVNALRKDIDSDAYFLHVRDDGVVYRAKLLSVMTAYTARTRWLRAVTRAQKRTIV